MREPRHQALFRENIFTRPPLRNMMLIKKDVMTMMLQLVKTKVMMLKVLLKFQMWGDMTLSRMRGQLEDRQDQGNLWVFVT